MVGVAVVQIRRQAIAEVTPNSARGPGGRLLPGLGDRARQPPARPSELTSGPRQSPADPADVADRPHAPPQDAVGRPAAVSLGALGNGLLVGHMGRFYGRIAPPRRAARRPPRWRGCGCGSRRWCAPPAPPAERARTPAG